MWEQNITQQEKKSTYFLRGGVLLFVIGYVLDYCTQNPIPHAKEFTLLLNVLCTFSLTIGSLQQVSSEKELIKIRQLKYSFLEKINLIHHNNTSLQEALNTLEKEKKALSEKYQELNESIDYAQSIQQSMLPDTHMFNSITADRFVLFRPKDKVSGDFYWFGKVRNFQVIIVADCTGHGVAGAMLSFMAYNLLYDFLAVSKITDPIELLHKMDERIQILLRGKDVSIDMGVCFINTFTRKLYFSGAKRPLLYTKNGELCTVKGDRCSVGGLYSTRKKKKFTAHEIQYQADTRFYMYSDGYTDQFNGSSGKKFGSRQLRRLIDRHHHESMLKQRSIYENALDKWQGGAMQIDDIILVGFTLG
ncbi:hypothetical protein GCM10023331_02940 [Algivirga pacifica]|uniref:PPM-type phosphatase domain-containing protein n=1 Tax=Algivirga pacifica TaxID=1162670 RepID=A0ABP9D1F4_9BACT